MAQIPAIREKSFGTITSHYFKVDVNDVKTFSVWRRNHFDDYDYDFNTFDDSREQSTNTNSVAVKISRPTNNEESQMVSLAVHKKALAEKDAIEAAIRYEADPTGRYSRNLIDTAGLVKGLRKRHRDALEENRADKNAMRIEREDLQHRFNDDRDRLSSIIDGQNTANHVRYEQNQQMREDFRELEVRNLNLLADNEAKDQRIKQLELEAELIRETCDNVTKGSVEALSRADRRMERRLTLIIKDNEKKHREEMDELRGWNVTIQDRLKIARRLQPVLIFHRAQVGTVCEMHEKLVQMKKAKKEELAAKDDEIRDLRSRNEYQARQIQSLEDIACEDRNLLKETANMLSDTRKALREAEGKIGSHQREVARLNRWGKEWENGCHARSQKIVELMTEMNTMRATHRGELLKAQARIEGLETSIRYCQEAKDRMDRGLEAWENGHGGGLRAFRSESNGTLPRTDAESLIQALKAANARADTLQISVHALQTENSVLQTQLGSGVHAQDPESQERLERLQSENQILGKAAGEAAVLKSQAETYFTGELEKLKTQFAQRTHELERGFNQGFENLRGLRDQWLLQKRNLEEKHNRDMVAADAEWMIERQGREEQFMAIWKEREKEIQRKEDDLQSREADLTTQARSLDSSGQNLITMKSRAERAEGEVHRLQAAAVVNEARWNLAEQNLNSEIYGQRRNGQRHMDLLNEEISKMAEVSRLQDLHNELQYANNSINNFQYDVVNVGTNSESLSQGLFGADFYASDERLLQLHKRPVLLAQLQAAKGRLNQLRNLLAESPNVDAEKAISILTAPRGDENIAKPAEDSFDDFDEPEQSSSRKRSEAPLGGQNYESRGENTAYDDWGGQEVSNGAEVSTSTAEKILKRPKSQPKSRRNGEPAKTVP